MHPAVEILLIFLRLGVTSFGGPVAHLGYFRLEFVKKRGWIAEADFASLVALCQFLPGPSSSQTGFGIGLLRAGWLGGLAAWVGFTLPSAVLMFAIATHAAFLNASDIGRGMLHGLQLAAVAVVAQALHSMALTLCPDNQRRVLAMLSLLLVFLLPTSAGQITVISLGGLAGRFVLAAPATPAPFQISRTASDRGAIGALVLYSALLAGAFLHARGAMALFDAFYRTGALVFGGGHVVLPLLHDAVVQPGWVSRPLFLAGYGAAQAMPGPVFTFAAFLGAVSSTGAPGIEGATVALIGIFLPGLLLTAGILPFWPLIRQQAWTLAALNGVNAAVVGLLGFVLIGLLTQGTIRNPLDILISITALALLTIGKIRPMIVVAVCAAAGATFALR